MHILPRSTLSSLRTQTFPEANCLHLHVSSNLIWQDWNSELPLLIALKMQPPSQMAWVQNQGGIL